MTLDVAFVVDHLDMGGAERHVVTMTPALDAERFYVTVHCLSHEGTLAADVGATGVRVRSHETRGRRAAPALAAFRLWRCFQSAKPDVVVTSGFRAGVLGRLVARAAGVDATLSWKHNIGHLGAVGIKERWSERLLKRWTTRYVGVCHSQLRYLVDEIGLDPERIGVVHNSVKIHLPRRGPDQPPTLSAIDVRVDRPVIGVVAMLRREKDHPTVLRALAELAQRGVGATLVVVGDGPERSNLVALSRSLGVEQQVKMLGQRDDVAELLPLFDVLVLASYTVECFPYAVLEAMAAGVPVVATAVGGLPEMIEDGVTGLLVPPRAPIALADALGCLLGDQPRARRIGMAGRRALESRWPFDSSVSKIEEELSRVVVDSRKRKQTP